MLFVMASLVGLAVRSSFKDGDDGDGPFVGSISPSSALTGRILLLDTAMSIGAGIRTPIALDQASVRVKTALGTVVGTITISDGG